jgi:Sec-independent protein secretion pathway component TatC
LSQLMLAIPLCILYELGIIIAAMMSRPGTDVAAPSSDVEAK